MKTKNESLIEILKKKDTLRQKIDQNQDNIQDVLNIKPKDISLFHISELTFEDESPRKEALENILSSLKFDGVSFIYLLLGDKKGVSFYFGIVKDKGYTKELELDVDDIGSYILKPTIEGNFRGSSIVEVENKKEILQKIDSMKRFARIDGVPSVNEDSEDFQGVDRLVDIMAGDEFGLMVISDPLTIDEIQDIENTLYDVYNKLSPLAKESIQESVGETKTTGTNEGASISTTTGDNENISENTSHGTSTGTSASKGESSGSSSSTNSSKSENVGKNNGYSLTISTGSNSSETKGKNNGRSESVATNQGETKSREFADKVVSEWMSYIDEILLKRVDYGRNKGIFHTGIYIFSQEKGNLFKLGNTIASLFSGSEENKAPLKTSFIENQKEIEAIKNFQLPTTTFENNNILQAKLLFSKYGNKVASWLSTKELSVITGLPKKEVVGLVLKEEVEFGLNTKVEASNDTILLGNLVKSGTVLDVDIEIQKESINKHIFIAGVTGSGKTTTCQRLLHSAKMPFMVIEPAKTEYRVLTKEYDDILIFTLNNETVAPFRLNPFELFKGESITSRVDMIKANIEAAFDMEAAIPQIIETALYRCYEEYGWDIATNTNNRFTNPFADGVFSFPTLSDLVIQTEVIVNEQGFDDRLKNDYIGSIKARLQGLLIGAKGFMLNAKRSVDFTELVERNVIIELEDIKNGAEKSLIMGFILINLNEAIKRKHTEYKQKDKAFQHITLIEEAHRLLSKFSAGDNPSKKLGVETFADMLAEVRKYGESLIIVDQIPNKLTPEVLKNTNTKIVHKLFASDDKDAIGNTMALDKEQKEFLSSLETGRVIVSNQDFVKPIQVQIRELEDISTTKSDVIDEQTIRENALRYYLKNAQRGMILGLELQQVELTTKDIDRVLKYNLEALSNGWKKICTHTTKEFVFNIKEFLLNRDLEKELTFVSTFIISQFYNESEVETKEWIENNLVRFLKEVIENDKNKFSVEEQNYFEL
jgi:hypothetical protein